MWSPQHRSLLPFTSRSSISERVVIYRMSSEENKTSLAKFCSSNHTVNTINNLVKSQIVVRIVFRISIALFADYEIPDLSEEETGGKSADNDTFTLQSKGHFLNKHQSERQRRSSERSGSFSTQVEKMMNDFEPWMLNLIWLISQRDLRSKKNLTHEFIVEFRT